jgi:hypothetical protein
MRKDDFDIALLAESFPNLSSIQLVILEECLGVLVEITEEVRIYLLNLGTSWKWMKGDVMIVPHCDWMKVELEMLSQLPATVLGSILDSNGCCLRAMRLCSPCSIIPDERRNLRFTTMRVLPWPMYYSLYRLLTPRIKKRVCDTTLCCPEVNRNDDFFLTPPSLLCRCCHP